MFSFDRRRLKHPKNYSAATPLAPPASTLARMLRFPAAGSTVSHLSFFFEATKHEGFA
jgi:hypothetical protein